MVNHISMWTYLLMSRFLILFLCLLSFAVLMRFSCDGKV